ncbi:sensor histidine kinase [Singulisphaera sp. PoT]|uniref:sensor histidine kinase n=1 Tax=Singulisphaera sp. PoT TaxID=3411797 RepID=UPI003BF5050C
MVVVCVILVAGFALMGVAAYRWGRTLAEIERGVNALLDGKPTRPILSRSIGPAGRLARRFDAVAPQLEARIALLEQDRQQLRAVLSGMAEGVIAIDARRRLVFANATANRLFSLDAVSVGRLIPELIRSPQVQEAVEATLGGPGPYQGEISLATRETLLRVHSRVLAVYGAPFPGPPPGAVLVFHDVTELRRLERMRQDFVANVSHELKTPLASIKAYTETLLDWALNDENVNVRFLNRIEEQAERLNQLILDLLSLARIESGQEVYEHVPLALAPMITSCVGSHRDRADAKGLSLDLDLGPVDDQIQVMADEEAIRQIFDNLIDNAIKYTPEGGSVRVHGQLGPDGVVVEVADTGIGIPRDDLPRVFERFYRVDKARSRELGGTGLGLSIVKHLVQSIGGQITVSSRVGAGTQFTLTLPLFVQHNVRN